MKQGVTTTKNGDDVVHGAKPKRRRPTYAFGIVAFVPHPALRGLYFKTHICVDHVACPSCGAEIYEPCRKKRGWSSDPHYTRKDAFAGRLRRA